MWLLYIALSKNVTRLNNNPFARETMTGVWSCFAWVLWNYMQNIRGLSKKFAGKVGKTISENIRKVWKIRTRVESEMGVLAELQNVAHTATSKRATDSRFIRWFSFLVPVTFGLVFYFKSLSSHSTSANKKKIYKNLSSPQYISMFCTGIFENYKENS